MTDRTVPSIVALIPARSGSKRIPGKNLRPLDGHPLIAYTIASAVQSGIFADIVVSTDSEACAAVATHYGASVPFLRPVEYAGDRSPDIEWVEHAIGELAKRGTRYDCFSLLRPTSPFRQPETIRRAWDEFVADPAAESLRAVELCAQHPGKMWVVRGRRMHPLLPFGPAETPWHSSQYPTLPQVYVQNASLEIAWTRVVEETGTIAGEAVLPFFTTGYEGFDVNGPHDWLVAAELVRRGEARLPDVAVEPYSC